MTLGFPPLFSRLVCLLFLDLPVQTLKTVGQSAYLVDETQAHSLLSVDHAADVRGHIVLFQHQGLEVFPGDAAVSGHKSHDPLLEPLKVVVGLGGGDDGAAHADGMDGHGGAGYGEAPPGRHREGHADGVAAPQNNGDRGLGHACDQLRDGKACLHVAAYGVQQKQDAVHILALLQLGEQGQDMLVLGGLGVVGGGGVALDLADDGQAIDGAVGCAGQGRAKVQDGLGDFLFRFWTGGFCGFSHNIRSLAFSGIFRRFSENTLPEAKTLQHCKRRRHNVRRINGFPVSALLY